MVIVPFLAMTKAEFRSNPPISSPIAWMACHFSPYGTGLSNLPEKLPPGSLLILNDRTPWWHHDPRQILYQLQQQLEALSCRGLLLDFQRPDVPEAAELASLLAKELPCPVGVSEAYAPGLNCPVFLSPVPLTRALKDHIAPWEGREIWLEAALECEEWRITEEGSTVTPLPCCVDKDDFFLEEHLHCHYRTDMEENQVRFILKRTREDMDDLLAEAAAWGVTTAVGLWQELG